MGVFTLVLLILGVAVQLILALSRYIVYSLPPTCIVGMNVGSGYLFPSATGCVITQRVTVTAVTRGGKQERACACKQACVCMSELV